MRLSAPPGFNAKTFYSDVYTFQSWEIFPGHLVPGEKPVGVHLSVMGAPNRLEGARVLDIGPWNGFFGFELLRRGARELVALGPDDPNVTGFTRTAKLLEVEDRVRYIQSTVYEIARLGIGKFDFVMFLGVIYHLRHPLLALDLLHDLCNSQATVFIDSPTIDPVSRVAHEAQWPSLREAWDAVQSIPLSTFVRGGGDAPLGSDRYNWFIPNTTCFRAWLASSGFVIEHEHIAPEWISVKARIGDRPFVCGLEGYNALRQASSLPE